MNSAPQQRPHRFFVRLDVFRHRPALAQGDGPAATGISLPTADGSDRGRHPGRASSSCRRASDRSVAPFFRHCT